MKIDHQKVQGLLAKFLYTYESPNDVIVSANLLFSYTYNSIGCNVATFTYFTCVFKNTLLANVNTGFYIFLNLEFFI